MISVSVDSPVIVHDSVESVRDLINASLHLLMISVSVDPPVVVHDGVQSVGDGDDGASAEGGADGVLDQRVRFHVNRRRRFVQNQNLGPP